MNLENGTLRILLAVLGVLSAFVSGGLGDRYLRGPTVPKIVVDSMRQGFTTALIETHHELEQCREQRLLEE